MNQIGDGIGRTSDYEWHDLGKIPRGDEERRREVAEQISERNPLAVLIGGDAVAMTVSYSMDNFEVREKEGFGRLPRGGARAGSLEYWMDWLKWEEDFFFVSLPKSGYDSVLYNKFVNEYIAYALREGD